MNPQIQRLYDIAQKSSRLIIGLMSGTSLDGLDIALCRITGAGRETKLDLLHFETVGYSAAIKKDIQSVFAKQQINLEDLCLLNPRIGLLHAEMINNFLAKHKITADEVDLIASHGQTIYHAPERLHNKTGLGNATLQIGDGDHLAVATGIITISDFRQKHIAAGGEGAPLAVYGDRLLFQKTGKDRLLLNIGGIANFTLLPGNDEKSIQCTDTGPGNTMMDAYMRQQFPGKYFDGDAAVAKAGTVNASLLSALLSEDFFQQPFPKTTGPELFNLEYLSIAKEKSNTQSISVQDTMATLNHFSADSVALAINTCIKNSKGLEIYVSGGGAKNPLLIERLKTQLPGCFFATTEVLNIDPDAKEAVLFAILANECICADISGKNLLDISMGKISLPK